MLSFWKEHKAALQVEGHCGAVLCMDWDGAEGRREHVLLWSTSKGVQRPRRLLGIISANCRLHPGPQLSGFPFSPLHAIPAVIKEVIYELPFLPFYFMIRAVQQV